MDAHQTFGFCSADLSRSALLYLNIQFSCVAAMWSKNNFKKASVKEVAAGVWKNSVYSNQTVI